MPYIIKKSTLTGIADAIRGKTGGTDKMNPVEMASVIEGISAGGGVDLSGLSIRTGTFTPTENITTSYDIITDEGEPDGYAWNRIAFLLFRKTPSTDRGILSIGFVQANLNSDNYGPFGSYIGGMGNPVPDLSNHSVIPKGNTIQIKCSGTAPLSRHEYMWIELRVE